MEQFSGSGTVLCLRALLIMSNEMRKNLFWGRQNALVDDTVKESKGIEVRKGYSYGEGVKAVG